MLSIIQTIKSIISSELALMHWKDYVEIGLLSLFFYYIARWLQADTQKNLLPYFYGYLSLVLVAHFCEFATIGMLLFLFSPAVAMLFMMMHQTLLQHNLVSLKNISIPAAAHSPDWLTSLMKATLTALAHNKDILMVIEHTDALSSLLLVPEPLDVPLSDGLLSLLLNSVYTPQKICWVSSNGYLRGMNVQFKASWHPASYQTEHAWIDDAIAYTAKTDAIVLYAHAGQHNVAIAHHGSIVRDLSMEQARQHIKKIINYTVPLPNKGMSHGVSQSTRFAQRSP